MLLKIAYDGFRLLPIVHDIPNQLSSLLLKADFSKLDCYLDPSVKTSKTRVSHLNMFEWLIEESKVIRFCSVRGFLQS